MEQKINIGTRVSHVGLGERLYGTVVGDSHDGDWCVKHDMPRWLFYSKDLFSGYVSDHQDLWIVNEKNLQVED